MSEFALLVTGMATYPFDPVKNGVRLYAVFWITGAAMAMVYTPELIQILALPV